MTYYIYRDTETPKRRWRQSKDLSRVSPVDIVLVRHRSLLALISGVRPSSQNSRSRSSQRLLQLRPLPRSGEGETLLPPRRVLSRVGDLGCRFSTRLLSRVESRLCCATSSVRRSRGAPATHSFSTTLFPPGSTPFPGAGGSAKRRCWGEAEPATSPNC